MFFDTKCDGTFQTFESAPPPPRKKDTRSVREPFLDTVAALCYNSHNIDTFPIKERVMIKRYPYSYYLKDLLVCDQHHITTVLSDLCSFETNIFEIPEVLFKLNLITQENLPSAQEKVRQKFIEWNAMLDEYHVNKEMRFDVDDMLYAIRFHRTLFAFMPEEKCEEHILSHREHLAAKGDGSVTQ